MKNVAPNSLFRPYVLIIGLICASLAGMSGCSLFPKPSAAEPNASRQPANSGSGSEAATPTGQADPVRDLVRRMSLEEKLGQMVLVGMDGTELGAETKQLIGERRVGGIILYESNITAVKQIVALTNALKAANAGSKLPLLLSADQEGGKVSRLPKELAAFPASRAVGESNQESYAYRIGQGLGQALRAVGLNTDYAPVLDVNTNPNNPVIGDRSFGTTSDVVGRMGVQELKGLRAVGAVGVVKHFPGHGDTSVDSHKGLPVVERDLMRLRSVELLPFTQAIREGAPAVMVGHLLMSKLDPEVPASMSPIVIRDLLRGEMKFNGVVFTDDMTMEAIGKTMEIGAAAVRSVQAGADIVMVGHSPAKMKAVLDALAKAAQSGAITAAVIDDSVYRIAKLKQDAKLSDALTAVPDAAELNRAIRAAVKR